jgi:hypothetical protein
VLSSECVDTVQLYIVNMILNSCLDIDPNSCEGNPFDSKITGSRILSSEAGVPEKGSPVCWPLEQFKLELVAEAKFERNVIR